MEEPKELEFDAAEKLAAQTYATFSNPEKECYIIVGRGAFAFRFGPFTPPEAGKILEWSVKERVVVTLVMQCGKEFDKELAKDMGMRMILPEDRKTPAGLLARLIKKFKRNNGEMK